MDLPISVEGDVLYIRDTSALLVEISKRQAGNAVFEKIRAHGTVVIRPYIGSPGEKKFGPVNAYHDPGSAYVRDDTLRQETVVWFSPSIYAMFVTKNGLPMLNSPFFGPARRPDEVLLHELAHASRYLGGDNDDRHLYGSMALYDDMEEFFAILVSNIYLSEKGYPASFLRSNHHGHKVLEFWKNTSETFLYADDNYNAIATLCRVNPKVCSILNSSSAAFNPVRAYLEPTKPTPIPPPTRDPTGPRTLVQADTRPALTDDYLISLLKPRFRADDVPGYGARARELESVFASVNAAEAIPLYTRLIARPRGDLIPAYFYYHLSTATRQKLLDTLKARMTAR